MDLPWKNAFIKDDESISRRLRKGRELPRDIREEEAELDLNRVCRDTGDFSRVKLETG